MDISDNTISASLDYNECLLDNGEPLTVVFQDGSLAGREFNATFVKESTTQTRIVGGETQTVTRPANRFELVKANLDGVNMPTRNFLPSVGSGHKYIVYNCYLPQSYIRDDNDFSGAEWDAMREACAFLYDNKDIKRTYKGSIDGLYAKRNWNTIQDRLVPGSYISFSHPAVQAEPIATRIVGIRQYVNDPYAPEIEISNETVSVGMASHIQTLQNNEASMESSISQTVRYAKRGFKDAKETAQMLVDAALSGFTGAISPIAVQTMQALVGDESLQYEFVTSLTNMTVVDCPLYYDATAKKLKSDNTSYIRHYTLGRDKNLQPRSTDYTDYRRWAISAKESSTLSDASKSYYVYAKVSKTQQTGSFELYEESVPMVDDTHFPNDWHLLLGILNSENEGDRSFVTLYGFTEVLPGRITTEKVVSSSGASYFDLLNNALKLGDRLLYNVNGNNSFILNGAFVQTGSGASVAIGAYCGVYDNSRVYKEGDEVSYTSNGATVTFRYKNGTASSGHTPVGDSQDQYWEISARGKDGENGKGISGNAEIKYASSSNGTSPPSSGWGDSIPSVSDGNYLWTRTTITYTSGSPSISYSVARQGQNGSQGVQGYSPTSPIIGNWYSGISVYANPYRTDVVKTADGIYYRAKILSTDEGYSFTSTTDPRYDSEHFVAMGGSFESLATGLLIADNADFNQAYIRNAIVAKLLTNASGYQLGTGPRIEAQSNWLSMFDSSGTQRLKISGDNISSASGSTTFPSSNMDIGPAGVSVTDTEAIEGATVTGSGTINSSLSVTAANNNFFIPSISVSGNYGRISGTVMSGSIRATVSLSIMVDGAAVASGQGTSGTIQSGTRTGSLTLTIPATNTTLSVGTHTIGYSYSITFRASRNYVSAGDVDVSARGSVSANSFVLSYLQQITEFGPNGFRVMFSSTDMLQAINSQSGSEFTMRAGSYVLRVTSAGIKKSNDGGSNWKNLEEQW